MLSTNYTTFQSCHFPESITFNISRFLPFYFYMNFYPLSHRKNTLTNPVFIYILFYKKPTFKVSTSKCSCGSHEIKLIATDGRGFILPAQNPMTFQHKLSLKRWIVYFDRQQTLQISISFSAFFCHFDSCDSTPTE